jgi:hypothetical protein
MALLKATMVEVDAWDRTVAVRGFLKRVSQKRSLRRFVSRRTL